MRKITPRLLKAYPISVDDMDKNGTRLHRLSQNAQAIFDAQSLIPGDSA